MTRRIVGAVALVTVAAVALPGNAYPRAGSTTRVSVSSSGEQGNGDSSSEVGSVPVMTPDGRYVAFSSKSSNLVPGDINLKGDVFRHDQVTGRTEIASIPTGGVAGMRAPIPDLPATCSAGQPTMSADGRYVAFTACYTYLDNRPTGPFGEVWVHDFKSGVTTRVSVTRDLGLADGSSRNPSISANGRYIAFESTASNLGPDHCPKTTVERTLCQQPVLAAVTGQSQIYVRDMKMRVTRVVSVGSNGSPANGPSYFPSISPDGQLVAFTSNANSLTNNDVNTCPVIAVPSCPDVYVRDLRRGKTQLVSVGLNGLAPQPPLPGNGAGQLQSQQLISADNRYVAFTSNAPGYVPNTGALGNGAVYIRDLRAQRTERVSVSNSGEPLGIAGTSVALDATGTHAAFAGNMPCGVGQQDGALAWHDVVTGATVPVDRRAYDGHENSCDVKYTSANPHLSRDGRLVAFASGGSNLVRGDTNNVIDVFVRDVGPDLGVGGLVSSGRLRVVGADTFATTGVASRVDAAADVNGTLIRQGCDLAGVSLAYRPRWNDLFVRVQVTHMPLFALASPLTVYGVDLKANDTPYQVRIAKTGLGASFTLLRYQRGHWEPVADLNGGYGTTGQEVVAAVPMSPLGIADGGIISAVTAYAGVRTATGVVDVADRVALSHRH